MNAAAVRERIRVDTAACVEETKSGKFLGGFFYPRKKAEPGCEQQARAKYANELAEAEREEEMNDDALEAAFRKTISGDNTEMYTILIAVFIFLIIALIIIF